MKRFKTGVSPWAVPGRDVSPFLLSSYFSEIMGNNNCLVPIKRVHKRHPRKVGWTKEGSQSEKKSQRRGADRPLVSYSTLWGMKTKHIPAA